MANKGPRGIALSLSTGLTDIGMRLGLLGTNSGSKITYLTLYHELAFFLTAMTQEHTAQSDSPHRAFMRSEETWWLT